MQYLTTADAIALHGFIMDQLGQASQGLRDEGLLESALNRPRMAAYYEDADLVRQAVLLAVGIPQSQPFVDGNKRTAFICLDTFLGLNDHAYTGSPMELAVELERVAERKGGLDEATDRFEAWLREKAQPSQT